MVKERLPIKKIKILYVLGAFSSSGGVESVVSNIYERIDHKSIKIDFVLFNGLDHSKVESIKKSNSKIFYIDRIRKNVIKFIYHTYKILRQGQYDIIHTHTNELGLFSLFAGLIARTPVRIAHSHNTSFRNSKYIPIFKIPFRLIPTHLFACSEAAGIALFGRGASFSVINNAINVEKYLFNKETSNRVKKELGIENKFIIGHVGRLSYQKNHSFLLRVFKKIVKEHNNAVLLLIGDGELREELENLAVQLNIDKQVIFLGARNDVSELLQGVDIFLFPSHYEGLPVVLIEAQSAGLPCVVSDAITMEVNITNLMEFIPLETPVETWAKAVLKYTEGNYKKNMYTEIRDAGYEIESNVKKLEEFYMNSVSYNN